MNWMDELMHGFYDKSMVEVWDFLLHRSLELRLFPLFSRLLILIYHSPARNLSLMALNSLPFSRTCH